MGDDFKMIFRILKKDILGYMFKLFLWFQLWQYRLIFSKGPKSNLELLDQWFWSTFNSFLLTPTGTDSCIYLLPGMHQGCQKPQVDTWTTTEHQRREKSTANTPEVSVEQRPDSIQEASRRESSRRGEPNFLRRGCHPPSSETLGDGNQNLPQHRTAVKLWVVHVISRGIVMGWPCWNASGFPILNNHQFRMILAPHFVGAPMVPLSRHIRCLQWSAYPPEKWSPGHRQCSIPILKLLCPISHSVNRKSTLTYFGIG
jgi:hypothetical protein